MRALYYQFKLSGYTPQDLLVLNRVASRLYRRVRTLVSRVIFFLIGLALLSAGILLTLGGSTPRGWSAY